MNKVSKTLYRNNLKLLKKIDKEVLNLENNLGSLYILSKLNALKKNYERNLGYSNNSMKVLLKEGYRNLDRKDLEFNVYKDLNSINTMIYEFKNSQIKYSYLGKRQNDNENILDFVNSKNIS